MIYTKEDFQNNLVRLLSGASLSAFSSAADSLYTLTCRLDECGKKFNLTAITDPEEVLEKHIIDSLFCADKLSQLAASCGTATPSVIDVGAGAGFPSLPTAAVLPHFSVSAMDATAKKVTYMNETAQLAGITNFSAFCSRAEETARGNLRESFDFVTARAVARLNILLELCTPLLRVGGRFIAMKGAAANEEADEAERAASRLGLVLTEMTPYAIPGREDRRFLIVYTKNTPASEVYPRNFSQISKKPL